MTPMLMMMSREIRREPIDYEPPSDHRGWRPVHSEFYDVALAEWEDEKRRWDAGERPDYYRAESYPDGISFEDYHGGAPDPDYYLPGPAWPEGAVMGIRMYEAVSEGTPISAWHLDTEDGRAAMARELAFHNRTDGGVAAGMTEEQWRQIIDGQCLARDIHTGEVVGPGLGGLR